VDNKTKALEEEMRRNALRMIQEQKAAEEIYAKYPGIHPVTAIVMTGDYAGMKEWGKYFERGEWDFAKTTSMIGSYARMEWVLTMLEAGKVTPEEVYPKLPELWSSSDPDDTDPKFLELWKQAWQANGRKMIASLTWPNGKFVLPKVFANNRKKLVTVYRGEGLGSTKRGIAWSLDIQVAEKFAKGAGERVPHEGDVYKATVVKSRILAFIADRGESEVILDPLALAVWPQVVERFRYQPK
jgi:hypothetical protein